MKALSAILLTKPPQHIALWRRGAHHPVAPNSLDATTRPRVHLPI